MSHLTLLRKQISDLFDVSTNQLTTNVQNTLGLAKKRPLKDVTREDYMQMVHRLTEIKAAALAAVSNTEGTNPIEE